MKRFQIIILLIFVFTGQSALGFENKEAALRFIPDGFVSVESANDIKYAVVVEISTQRLFLYAYKGSYNEVFRMNCSTGKKQGPKSRSGDQKTPEGIYFFTKEYTDGDLEPIYGTRAFPIDYPNALDRNAGRNGNSIWLHGTNEVLKPRDTNGCIALENRDIDNLKKYIRLNRTPIILTDEISYTSADLGNETGNSILKFITDYNKALENGTYHDYLRFYEQDFLPDISWWKEWSRIKKNVSDQSFSVISKGISIFKHKDVYVTLFDQLVSFSEKNISAGTKKLFLAANWDGVKIISEEYQGVSDKLKGIDKKNPFIAACQELLNSSEKTTNVFHRRPGLFD